MIAKGNRGDGATMTTFEGGAGAPWKNDPYKNGGTGGGRVAATFSKLVGRR